MQLQAITSENMRQHLKTKWLGHGDIFFHEQLDSTSTEAIRLARQGAHEGTIVLADSQTGGRGRLARTWISPYQSGLYVSIIMRPKVAIQEVPKLSLAIGAAAATAVEEVVGSRPGLKWPNDIMISGGKVGGILIEGGTDQNQLHYAVVGIGINVNTDLNDFPPFLRETATSLLIAVGRPVDRKNFLQTLLIHIEKIYEAFKRQDFEQILSAWRKYDVTTGKIVRVILANREIIGVAEFIQSDGTLMVRDNAQALHQVVAGDVVHCKL